MENLNIEYCTCKKSSNVYSDSNDSGHWLKCSDCNKVIEDSFCYHDEPDLEELER